MDIMALSGTNSFHTTRVLAFFTFRSSPTSREARIEFCHLTPAGKWRKAVSCAEQRNIVLQHVKESFTSYVQKFVRACFDWFRSSKSQKLQMFWLLFWGIPSIADVICVHYPLAPLFTLLPKCRKNAIVGALQITVLNSQIALARRRRRASQTIPVS